MEVFNPFSLAGKTILVTGSSSGIGLAIAVSVSRMGANVVINGRNFEKLEYTFAQLVGENNSIIAADLTKSEDIAKIADFVPPLDGIVHCAGIGHRMPAKMLTENDIENIEDIELSFHIFDTKSWDTIKDTDTIKITF